VALNPPNSSNLEQLALKGLKENNVFASSSEREEWCMVTSVTSQWTCVMNSCTVAGRSHAWTEHGRCRKTSFVQLLRSFRRRRRPVRLVQADMVCIHIYTL